MHLKAYFARIGYDGTPAADLETLRALSHLHPRAIPFENLDVQLKRPVSMAPEAVFDKLVTRRRGGWCYEMNGLLGWALGEIGFDVRRVEGGVMREVRGDEAFGNHLCLAVRLDGRDYLVDVGFGGSQTAPMVIARGSDAQVPFDLELVPLENGYWRMVQYTLGKPFSFDFHPDRCDEALLADKCIWQQSNPESVFVQNLVAQKRTGDAHLTLRGRVFTRLESGAEETRLLQSGAELVDVLSDEFGIHEPEAEALWPAICARHEALFPQA
ncbi:MAG: arylamine N-acetyltransferase [Hyphomonas sp.]|nr:arylamine N-acetyltransferase [Hyphomonas sp.]